MRGGEIGLAGFRSSAKEFRLSIGEHPVVDFVLELGRILAKLCPNIVATRKEKFTSPDMLSGAVRSTQISKPNPIFRPPGWARRRIAEALGLHCQR